MTEDDHHEAHGAMVHRGLVEQRTAERDQRDDLLREAADALRLLTEVQKYAIRFSNGVDHNGIEEAEYWQAEAMNAALSVLAKIEELK